MAISSRSVIVLLFKMNILEGVLCNFFCNVSLITEQVCYANNKYTYVSLGD